MNKQEYAKQYYLDNRAKILQRSRETQFKRKYGITVAQRDAMIMQQDDKCACCGEEFKIIKRRGGEMLNAHVDHCHLTDKIRKVLCLTCNSGLGLFKDNPEYLKLAINYLEKNK